MTPLQPDYAPATYADVTGLIEDFDYKPDTNYVDGIKNFVDWYKKFYNLDY